MTDANIVNERTGEKWVYSSIVKDHFFNPRNFLLNEPREGEFDAVGMVGSPACGDVMKVWIKVDRATERITDTKWQTFGCGSAIASTSMFSVMVTENGGMCLADALQIKPRHIIERLGGLPDRKIHCSVLAHEAFRKAVNEYFRTAGQHKRIVEGAGAADEHRNRFIREKIEAILEEVRPSLRSHGGDAHLVSLDGGGNVTLKMEGACRGCPMSTLTFGFGIETMIKERVPEVKEIFYA